MTPPRTRPRAADQPGELISRARAALGESARVFAQRLGVDLRTVYRWEANDLAVHPSYWGLIYFHLREAGADPGLISALRCVLPMPARRHYPPVPPRPAK